MPFCNKIQLKDVFESMNIICEFELIRVLDRKWNSIVKWIKKNVLDYYIPTNLE